MADDEILAEALTVRSDVSTVRPWYCFGPGCGCGYCMALRETEDAVNDHE